MAEEVRALALPETGEVTTKADDALAFAEEIKVTDDHTYKVVGEFVVGVKKIRKEIRSLFYDGAEGEKDRGQVPLAHAAWKAGLAAFNKLDGSAKEAEEVASKKLAGYVEAKEKADREKAEVERKKAEDDRLEQAAALEKTGQRKAANELLAKPIETAPIRPSGPPKIAGLSSRKRWTFEITDATKIPREYLVPDEKKIRKIVEAMGAETKIDGVRAYQTTGMSGTGGR